MADYYSGSVNDIRRLVAQTVGIGAGVADVISEGDCEKFMAETDELINSELSQVYYVPLRKITRDGVQKYPDPIPRIARYITAANLILTYYKDIQPNESAAVRAMKEEALFSLNKLVNDIAAGSARLEGQKQKARNRFVRPTIAPSKPPTPTSGPAGGVG